MAVAFQDRCCAHRSGFFRAAGYGENVHHLAVVFSSGSVGLRFCIDQSLQAAGCLAAGPYGYGRDYQSQWLDV